MRLVANVAKRRNPQCARAVFHVAVRDRLIRKSPHKLDALPGHRGRTGRCSIAAGSIPPDLAAYFKPVAVRLTWYGPSGSGLSVTVSVADSAPTTVGAKVTISVQTVLAASVEVQVPPVTLKSPAFGPLKLSLSETELVR